MDEEYEVVRFYFDDQYDAEVIIKSCTLEEAREHCNDPEANSATATSEMARKWTAKMGPWFDGYRSL